MNQTPIINFSDFSISPISSYSNDPIFNETNLTHSVRLMANELCKIQTELKKIQDTLIYMQPMSISSNTTNVNIPVNQLAHIEERKSIEIQHKLHFIVCDKLHTLHEDIKNNVIKEYYKKEMTKPVDDYFEQLFIYTDKLYGYDPIAYIVYNSGDYEPYNMKNQHIYFDLYLITTHNVYKSYFSYYMSNGAHQIQKTDLLQSRIYTFNAPLYYNYPLDIFNALMANNEHKTYTETPDMVTNSITRMCIEHDKKRFEKLIHSMYNLIPGVNLSQLQPGWTEIYNINGYIYVNITTCNLITVRPDLVDTSTL